VAGRVERVEGGVESRKRHVVDAVEVGLELADRSEQLLRIREVSRIAPHHAAHLVQMQVLGKRRSRRYGEKGEETAELLGRGEDELAVPLHDFLGAVEGP